MNIVQNVGGSLLLSLRKNWVLQSDCSSYDESRELIPGSLIKSISIELMLLDYVSLTNMFYNPVTVDSVVVGRTPVQ